MYSQLSKCLDMVAYTLYVGLPAKNGHQYISIDIMFDTFITASQSFDFQSNNKGNQDNHIQRKKYPYGQEKKTGRLQFHPKFISAIYINIITIS